MGVSKVDLNGETLVDLTGDTVAENNLLQGAIAHNAAGEQIVGNATIPTVGNGKITINQAGVKKGEFTVNQSGNATVNLDGGSDISLTNNLLATVPGVSALDAAVGSVIQGEIDEINDNLSSLSAKTEVYTYIGTVGNDGYITVPHNLNIQSYVPFTQVYGAHVFLTYNIVAINKNSFKIGVLLADGYNLSSAAGQTVNVYYILV